MIKKALLGCAVLLILFAVAFIFLGADWNTLVSDGENGTGDEELRLTRWLAAEFDSPVTVEFVCVLPVVGEAPCLPGRAAGRREVTVTFSGYEMPVGVDPRELARRIAVVARQASAFVEKADKATVVFYQGDESASVVRTFSFEVEEPVSDGTDS